MEIKITKHALLSGLSKTVSIADRKSSLQILSNVLLEAHDSENVRIAATDLNLFAMGLFPAEVIEAGSVTVPAKTVHDVVRNLPDGLITLKLDGDQVLISAGRADFSLLTLPADDFPNIPDSSGLDFFDIDTNLLSRMIEQTSFSISTDETRSHINGALFQGDGKNLRMVTTDGHRLSKVEFLIDESGFYNFSMVVPNRGIGEIRRLVEDRDGVVSIALRDGSVFLRREVMIEKEKDGEESISSDILLISKLVEDEFPPYDQVIPKHNEKRLVVSRIHLLDALRRVSVVSAERTLGVHFQLSEGVLGIVTNNPSIGRGSEEIDVVYDEDEMTIGFNARYLIDILSVLEDDEIKLELSGPLDPVIVMDSKELFIGVVMPMRI